LVVTGNREATISAFLVSGVSLVGRALGLVKTMVIAWIFGATHLVDAFFVAYMLPTILPMIAKSMISTAFIPRFMRSLRASSDSHSWQGANTLFTVALGIFLLATIALAAFPEFLVKAVAPGLPPETFGTAVTLTRVMATATIFLGINAILSAIAYARHRFVYASLETVLTNSAVILGTIVFAPHYGIVALGWSVVAGFMAQTILLIVANRDLLVDAIRPAFAFRHEDFRAPLRHIFPLTVGAVGAVATGLVDQIFASYLDAGSIAVLGYATMLALLPMEIFGQPIRTTFYPLLSRHHADGNYDAMRDSHIRGLRVYILVMLPAIGILIMFGEPAVAVLLQRGSFDAQMTEKTAWVIIALSLGLLSRAFAWFNFGVFHALVQPWIPVVLGLVEVAINIVLTWMLVGPFGVFGIGLATSLALTVTAVVTTVLLTRRLAYPIAGLLVEPFLKVAGITAAALVVAYVIGRLALIAFEPSGSWWRNVCLLSGLAPAAAIFFWAGWLLRLGEISSLLSYVRRKISGETAIEASRP